MKDMVKRILLVGLVQLLAFEILSQLSVHWRESTGELCDIALMLATCAALIWAVLPAFPQMQMRMIRVVFRCLLVTLSFVGLYAVDYFHFWHLRPNLGLYHEADWVAEHPGFQREMQARISKNMWRSPNQDMGPVATTHAE